MVRFNFGKTIMDLPKDIMPQMSNRVRKGDQSLKRMNALHTTIPSLKKYYSKKVATTVSKRYNLHDMAPVLTLILGRIIIAIFVLIIMAPGS